MLQYVFILCMEGLIALIQAKIEYGLQKSIQVERGGPMISHILFVDHVLLFSKASAS